MLKNKSGQGIQGVLIGKAGLSWNCRQKVSDKAGLILSQLWSPLRSYIAPPPSLSICSGHPELPFLFQMALSLSWIISVKISIEIFPGGPVADFMLPVQAGSPGSIPGQGTRSHML